MVDRSRPPLAVWIGIECTVNRVGDRYFDQLARSGHDTRLADLDLIAGLGVTAVRYPVLWERTAPGALADADWRFADERLGRLRELGVEPIVGLVHHGSGPAHTNLLDPAFPRLLADYAGAVAARFPWVRRYTPINEPLTTARFSGLYGMWYPHERSDLAFARALITQCRATLLAMEAIRAINPEAQLVHTEDLGWTHAPATLAYQARFENQRRWLGVDLLCGRVDGKHPLRRWLRSIGVGDGELDWFRDHGRAPDVLGWNYYVTSERWLDDDRAAWPAHTHGGNGRHAYADVEAVRACGPRGLEALLHAAWDRYRLPMAITEAHLGCTREQQLRWLVDVHAAACRARAGGAEVLAVTPWALLGAFDWHCLVTRDEGHYEPGVFDVRGSQPRPTALAAAVRALADGRTPDHPVLAGDGWWTRSARPDRRGVELT
jgi:dTDP-4-dehydrorhamnose reductase